MKFISAALISSAAFLPIQAAMINGIDLGECTEPPTINFGTGFQGSANGNEFRFKPMNEQQYPGQSTALNGNIITNFLCDRVNDRCKAPQATKDLCLNKGKPEFAAAFTAAGGSPGSAERGVAADVWNKIWGVTTNFKDAKASAPAMGGAGGAPAGNMVNGIDLGVCTTPPTIEFGTGFPGSANGNEFRFRPQNEKDFSGQSTALNGNIITNFLCDRVNDRCKAPQATKDLCLNKGKPEFAAAFTAAGGSPGSAERGVAADVWNKIWGVTTNFKDAKASAPAMGGAGGAAGGAPAGNMINGIDLGVCTQPPTINFGTGFQGSANGNEFRFKPMNEQQYPGQSTALNGNIITNFLCDRVNDLCKAPQSTKDLCLNKGKPDFAAAFTAAGGSPGSAVRGVAADVWNKIWGVTTNFANGQPAPAPAAAAPAAPVASAPAAPALPPSAVSPPTTITMTVTTTVSVACGPDGLPIAAPTSAPAAAPAAPAAPAIPNVQVENANNAATGDVVFKFNGALFGVAMKDAVVSSGDPMRKFKVASDTFVGFGVACQRACDRQKNQCANAVNSKAVTGTVAECDTQQQQCSAECRTAASTIKV